MNPYDAEVLTLGTTLRFGSRATALSVATLTADKFIFDSSAGFGREHSEIWQAIVDLSLMGREASVVNVISVIPEYAGIIRSLADRIYYSWHIAEFNGVEYLEWVNQVDKVGRVYHHLVTAEQQARDIKDLDAFLKTVDKVDDVDAWANEKLSAFQGSLSGAVTGYTHVSSIVESLKQKWEDTLSGKQSPLVDSGLPSLQLHKLFPKGKLAVIHGLSGSGKSSFVFQVLLGTALGLVRYNLPGCVAINSLEMDQEDLVERMASILSGVDVSKLINCSLSKDEVDRFMYWADIVAKLPIFVDGTNFITTTAMQYRASGLHVSAHGPVVQLASDYGELFADDEDTEEQRVNKVFRNQFRLARILNASVLAISQSTNDKSVTGKTYIAGPDGTRYSKGILQATDILAELWNPPQIYASGRANIVAPEGMSLAHPYLLVQKFRGGTIGTPIGFGWKPESTTFFDLAIDQEAGDETLFTHLEPLGYRYEVEGAW